MTERLVTSPPMRRVTPKARVMGHAVGAGSLTVGGAALLTSDCESGEDILLRAPLTTDDVDNGKDHDPHDVDKVPVHSKDIDISGVFLLDLAE